MTERKHTPLAELNPSMEALNRIQYVAPQPELHEPEEPRPEPDQEPEILKERRFVHDLFASARQTERLKAARGTVYPFVQAVLSLTDEDWQRSFPLMTRTEIAELSKSVDTVDIAALQEIADRHGITNDDYSALRPSYHNHIAELSPAYASFFDKGIAEGILSKPPYRSQISGFACTVSCFRMIFEGIAAQKPPSEYTIDTYMSEPANNADESLLFRTLSSPFFKNHTGRTVLNRILIGATFDDIAIRAEKITEKYPGSDVYAMMGIRNFDDQKGDAPHAVVLLHTDDETVTFHNPLDRSLCSGPVTPGRMGGKQETLSREEFVNRWALGLYTAHLVYALPPSE